MQSSNKPVCQFAFCYKISRFSFNFTATEYKHCVSSTPTSVVVFQDVHRLQQLHGYCAVEVFQHQRLYLTRTHLEVTCRLDIAVRRNIDTYNYVIMFMSMYIYECGVYRCNSV